ncbi:MAG TPA: hypothetical protein VIH35_01970 [Kiritimatiellia bacterium]|jgi:hypothetical protein
MKLNQTLAGLLTVAALSFCALEARAQGGLALGAKIGTLGPGLEMTAYITEHVNIRGGFNWIEFSWDSEVDDIEYDMDVQFESIAALVDIHPYANNFRITGGILWNNNEADLDGTIDEPTEIGGTTYTPAQIGTLTGTATFDDVAPYIGIGFGNAVMDDVDLTFSFDLGVMFQGAADVTLESDGALASDPQFQADLAEEEEDAQDVADDLTIYPVLAFGMAYYFW